MKNTLIKNAVIIALGGFLAKLLGAFYRIPLTNLIKAEGLGLYQMVFPVYCILLDFSSIGIPTGLSKLIAENKDERNISLFKTSLKFLTILGVLGALIMLVFSKSFATLQGNGNAFLGYIFLSPAVLLVAIISCFRGFFQGYGKMMPTAISQIIEQLIKLIFGLLFVSLLMPITSKAVAGATFAVTLSELFALIYIYIAYKIFVKKKGLNTLYVKPETKNDLKKIVKICLPVTFTSLLIPISQTIDSFLIINLLGKYLNNAVSLYGLLSGAVMSVINLPVALCYGLAVAALPLISKNLADKDKKAERKNGGMAIVLTVVLGGLFAIGCYFFADKIVSVLFYSIKGEEKTTTVNLLKIMSLSVVLLSFVQTTNSILIGKGKQYFPLISLGIGIVIKIIISVILLQIPRFNIYGGAISIIACYFVAGILNLVYYLYIGKRGVSNGAKENKRNNSAKEF